jgi:RNA polymerase sigma-70 factor (ECF subfamily)
MKTLIDEDIVRGLQEDSPQAMKWVFDRYYVSLCHLAKRYVGSRVEAEEIVSDVMYKIWQNRHNGYRADTFKEYLYTATRNTSINYIRQQLNQKKFADEWAEQLRQNLIEDTPLDVLVVADLKNKFEQLMQGLPAQCRRAYELSRNESMTYEEIATEMNISVNTVKYHIKTALHKLRDGLSDFLILLSLFINDLFFR